MCTVWRAKNALWSKTECCSGNMTGPYHMCLEMDMSVALPLL